LLEKYATGSKERPLLELKKLSGAGKDSPEVLETK
jgi:hypothetical protein